MSSEDYVKDDHPDTIVPESHHAASRKKTWSDRRRALIRACTTRDGLVGTYDYASLFTPAIPFVKKRNTRRSTAPPFFGLHDPMPLLLALLLGLQHALAMLAGIISPPILLSSAANLPGDVQNYLVSTALIVCAFLSAIQITRFRLWTSGTITSPSYHVGTGLLSVVGVSFSTIPVATGAFAQMYASGYCPSSAVDGAPLPCPRGYGAILGTQCVCALLEVGMSFVPSRWLKKIFPPLVTGPTVLLIGVALVTTGMEDWAGGSGGCMARPVSGEFSFQVPSFLP
jgi:xanthine/uracil permease